MGKVTIQKYTTINPITMIGFEAGVCQGADTSDNEKNYIRGIECLNNEHGRTFEFPDVYMTIEGYSARVIREWYTHIGCLPTRLQESTRYINYNDFEYVIPPSIDKKPEARAVYINTIEHIKSNLKILEELQVPREDIALLLPLGMTTKIVDKRNFRNLIDMSHQRMCNRAYHEYRRLFNDVCNALSNYSGEWKYLVDRYFEPKCKYSGVCKEKKSCGMINKIYQEEK